MGGLVDIPLSRLSCLRSGTATRVNASGLIEVVPADTPRIDYDPVTLACRGLLVEEGRRNLWTYSADLANAAWATSSASVAAGAVTAPDGGAAQKLLEAIGSAVEHSLFRVRTGSTETLTASIYARAAERSRIQIYFANFASSTAAALFDLSAGTVAAQPVASTDYTSPSAAIAPAGNGWYRCSLTATKGAANTTTAAIFCPHDGTGTVYAGDGSSGLYLWGAQLELGAFPTSYMPTTTATVARSGEAVSMPLAGWWNASAGTLLLESAYEGRLPPGVFAAAACLDDGTFANRIMLMDNPGAGRGLAVVKNGTSQALEYGPAATIGAVTREAAAWAVNDFAYCTGGGSVLTDGLGQVPVVTTLRLGSIVTVPVGARHIRRVEIFSRRLPAADLQSLTA